MPARSGSRDAWWQDVRYGLRTFRRRPMFTAVAVLTLGLGIGVNAGIFTVLNGVLFRDLPVPDAYELVSISQTLQGGQVTTTTGAGTFTMSDYRLYLERTQTLSGVVAHSDPRETTIGGDTPQEAFGSRRYRAISIRMVLGASARDVLGALLRQTMRPVVIGAMTVSLERSSSRAFCRACCSV